MQLGARWRAGEAPHRGVPPELYSAIAEQEAAHPEAAAWTLTFLEGRPRCALDDVSMVSLGVAGEVLVTRGSSITLDGTPSGGFAAADGAEDDDDWLS